MQQKFCFKKLPTLTTKRLRIRKPTKEDAKAIFELRNNLIINKYIKRTPPKTAQDVLSFIKKMKFAFNQQKAIYWIIELKNTKKIIGTVCFWNISKDKTYTEVGYELLPQFHKKGLMTETLQEVIHFGFKTIPFKTIEAFTHKDNKNSLTLLNKMKFVFLKDKKDIGFPYNYIFQLNQDN